MMSSITILETFLFLTKGVKGASPNLDPSGRETACVSMVSQTTISIVISQNLVLLSQKCTILPKLQFAHHTIVFPVL